MIRLLFVTALEFESIPVDIVIWEGSSTARLLNCRGWMRSEEDWRRRTNALLRKRDINVTRCVEDPKFRTRLCNHWDISKGAYCSMRKKNKCIFAHGPVELRVKEGKRHRWGTLVDELGDNNIPFHSGGEDTYGAARSIESKRKEDGQQWSNLSSLVLLCLEAILSFSVQQASTRVTNTTILVVLLYSNCLTSNILITIILNLAVTI